MYNELMLPTKQYFWTLFHSTIVLTEFFFKYLRCHSLKFRSEVRSLPFRKSLLGKSNSNSSVNLHWQIEFFLHIYEKINDVLKKPCVKHFINIFYSSTVRHFLKINSHNYFLMYRIHFKIGARFIFFMPYLY